MLRYQLIFLIADPSLHRTPAFERAVSLVKATGAALHMSLFVHSRAIALVSALSQDGGRKARCAFLHERRRWLEQEAESLRQRGVKVTTDAVWATRPRRDILRHILRLQPDLVVKDADSPSFAARLLPSLEHDLLTLCPSQVLLAHAASAGTSRRFAAAVDARRQEPQDRAFNEAIVAAASALANLCHAELHLIQADRHSTSSQPPSGQRLRRRARQPLRPDPGPLAPLAQAHEVPPERCHRLEGAAGPAIAGLTARDGIDLLVVGHTGRKPMQRLLHPDGFERISFYTPCDVLALKRLPDTVSSSVNTVAEQSPAAAAVPQLRAPAN